MIGRIAVGLLLSVMLSPIARMLERRGARAGDELRLFDARRSAMSARRAGPADALSIDKGRIDQP